MSDQPQLDQSRRAALLGVKLRALAGEHLDVTVVSAPEAIPGGAALMHGDAAWILIDGDASRSLGGALAWALRRGALSLDIVAEEGGGVLARRAAAFSFPIVVWFPVERSLVPAIAEPLTAPAAADPEHLALTSIITDAGATPNVEHGVVSGEVRGLEVCRVVDQPTVGFFAELGDVVPAARPAPTDPEDSGEGLRLEVGVGASDREAFQILHGDLPTIDALTSVVESVRSYRRVDSPQHPLNRLGRERFLRWQAEEAPESVGLVRLAPAEPPFPRPNLKDPVPCVAAGTDADGAVVHVVFSSGVDLDLVPYVADVQAMTDSRVVVALPRRDLLPLTRDVAALLVTPPEFVALD